MLTNFRSGLDHAAVVVADAPQLDVLHLRPLPEIARRPRMQIRRRAPQVLDV